MQKDEVQPVAHNTLVPGVMRCAKCKFRLVRVSMHAGTGQMTAGDNKTEPCPNGCGPLWPVTWKEEAQDADKLCEEQTELLNECKGLLEGAMRIFNLLNAGKAQPTLEKLKATYQSFIDEKMKGYVSPEEAKGG